VLSNGSWAARVRPKKLKIKLIFYKGIIIYTLNESFVSQLLTGHINMGFTSIFSLSSASAIVLMNSA